MSCNYHTFLANNIKKLNGTNPIINSLSFKKDSEEEGLWDLFIGMDIQGENSKIKLNTKLFYDFNRGNDILPLLKSWKPLPSMSDGDPTDTYEFYERLQLEIIRYFRNIAPKADIDTSTGRGNFKISINSNNENNVDFTIDLNDLKDKYIRFMESDGEELMVPFKNSLEKKRYLDDTIVYNSTSRAEDRYIFKYKEKFPKNLEINVEDSGNIQVMMLLMPVLNQMKNPPKINRLNFSFLMNYVADKYDGAIIDYSGNIFGLNGYMQRTGTKKITLNFHKMIDVMKMSFEK